MPEDLTASGVHRKGRDGRGEDVLHDRRPALARADDHYRTRFDEVANIAQLEIGRGPRVLGESALGKRVRCHLVQELTKAGHVRPVAA